MKIAVCVSGQLRKLDKNLISDAFKDHDVDYYVHTWEHDLNPNYNKIRKYTAIINLKILLENLDTY